MTSFTAQHTATCSHSVCVERRMAQHETEDRLRLRQAEIARSVAEAVWCVNAPVMSHGIDAAVES